MMKRAIFFVSLRRLNHRSVCALAFLSVFLLTNCGKPGGDAGNNYTHSYVTVTSVNDNKPLQSDVLTKGAGVDDIVTVKFKSAVRQLGSDEENPTDPDGISAFDTIILHTYHVEHQRSDGGANPPDFVAGMNLTLEPNSEGEANIVIVRALDKHRTPLQELRDSGQIFTTCVITFYGEDGYGNDLSVTGSLAVLFGNYPDN